MLRFDIDLDFATFTTVTGFDDLKRTVCDNTNVLTLLAQEQTMVTDDQVFTQVDTPFRLRAPTDLGVNMNCRTNFYLTL